MTMPQEKTWTVAVTGVSASENPGPGIGVARCLRDWRPHGLRLIALAYEASECAGLYGDLFDEVVLMPFPGQHPQATLRSLREIRLSQQVDVLVPCLDAEIPLYLALAEEIRSLGIRLRLPTKEAYRKRDKIHLAALSLRMGVPVPETRVIHAGEQAADAAADLGFPLMVKGNHYGAQRVDTLGDLHIAIDSCTRDWGYPVLLQRWEEGPEINLAGLGDGEGKLLGSVALRKETVTRQGKIWTGVSVNSPWLLQAAQRFVEETRWDGPFEVECILRTNGGGLLVEINPRFPAWIFAGAGLGWNLPAMHVARLLGEAYSFPEFPAPAGKWFVRTISEQILDSDPFDRILGTGKTYE